MRLVSYTMNAGCVVCLKCMRKKVFLFLLGATSLVCAYLVAEPLWLRHWTHHRVGLLTSDDRSLFSQAYFELAHDPDSRVSLALLDELEEVASRETYYQIVRVLYSRTGVHFAPEDVALPSVATMRKLVKDASAQGNSAARNP